MERFENTTNREQYKSWKTTIYKALEFKRLELADCINFGVYEDGNWNTKSIGNIDDRGLENNKNRYFDIASMTKVFTALQYFDLMEKTGYNLETHPGNFLKELSRFDGLTVADLMSHRHGLVTTQPYDVNQKYTTQELNTIFHSSDSLQQSQPNQYIYRDTGYYYLGKILELIEGKPLAQINKEFLEKNAIQGITYQPTQNGIPEENIAKSDEFKPIGIPHDNTVSDWFGGVSGFAGLYATQAGLQSFTQKLLENDFQIEPELYKKLFEIQHPANSKNQQSYSLGGWRKGFMSDKYLNISGFTGPGIILDVENKRGIVMTTNITFPKRDEVRTNIYRQWVRSIVKDS